MRLLNDVQRGFYRNNYRRYYIRDLSVTET
jgi:hypothetical protein